MHKIYLVKEIYNNFLLYENFLSKAYFEEEVEKLKIYLKTTYPGAQIIVKRNKVGARVLAYKELKNREI